MAIGLPVTFVRALVWGVGGHWPLVLVVFLPALSVGLAWYLCFFADFRSSIGSVSYGELISASQLRLDLPLFDESGERYTQDRLEGRWAVLIFGREDCSDPDCRRMLYQTRQAHLALGRKSSRVVRLVVTPQSNAVGASVRDEHLGVVWLQGDRQAVVAALGGKGWPLCQFFIVDPLGNIMMAYRNGQSGTDLLRDLQRLLKFSRAG